MKFARTFALSVAFTAAILAAGPAAAQRAPDPVNSFAVGPVLERPDFTSQTNGVRFYFGSTPHPAVAQRIQNNVTTSQRGRKAGRSAEEACQWTLMSALFRLRDAALQSGGNGVINIRSNWQNVETSSQSEFQCGVGRMMAGVALKADIVRLR